MVETFLLTKVWLKLQFLAQSLKNKVFANIPALKAQELIRKLFMQNGHILPAAAERHCKGGFCPFIGTSIRLSNLRILRSFFEQFTMGKRYQKNDPKMGQILPELRISWSF